MAAGPKPVKLHPDAQAEMQDSVSFYRVRGGDFLVARFKSVLNAALEAIAKEPQRYPLAGLGLLHVRKIWLSIFPFSVIYIDRPTIVWVVAIAHGSRRPGYWKERLPKE